MMIDATQHMLLQKCAKYNLQPEDDGHGRNDR